MNHHDAKFPSGTKLLIDGLPPTFTDTQLKKLFAPFGTILSARVILDVRGKSMRMAEVEMSMAREARNALTSLHDSSVEGALILVFER